MDRQTYLAREQILEKYPGLREKISESRTIEDDSVKQKVSEWVNFDEPVKNIEVRQLLPLQGPELYDALLEEGLSVDEMAQFFGLKKHNTFDEVASTERNTGRRYVTAPVDARFATTQNQANYCWTAYNEWVGCMRLFGGKSAECAKLKFYKSELCPNAWQSEWNDLREAGNFYGVQYYDPSEAEEEEEDDDDDDDDDDEEDDE